MQAILHAYDRACMMCERDEEEGKGEVLVLRQNQQHLSYMDRHRAWPGLGEKLCTAQKAKTLGFDRNFRKCKCKNIFLAMPGNSTGIHILSHIH